MYNFKKNNNKSFIKLLNLKIFKIFFISLGFIIIIKL